MEENIINNEAFNSVEFLFAKPYYQGVYMYALDDLDALSMIDKNSLKDLLTKLKCYNFIKIDYLLNRNLPLFFDVKKKKLMEFETSVQMTKKDIHDLMYDEIKEQLKPKEISNYERFFGENSTLYRQNFNEETLYGNNKSIQGNLSSRKHTV